MNYPEDVFSLLRIFTGGDWQYGPALGHYQHPAQITN